LLNLVGAEEGTGFGEVGRERAGTGREPAGEGGELYGTEWKRGGKGKTASDGERTEKANKERRERTVLTGLFIHSRDTPVFAVKATVART
jgi:hypothetical protein